MLVIGSSVMTLTANLYKIPAEGEEIYDDGGVAYTPDGKGTNAAIAFKNLGGDPILMTKLGRDSHGQRLFGFFKEIGLDTSLVKVDSAESTGFSMVLRVRGEENRTVRYLGASEHISAENALEAFAEEPDALYLGTEFAFDAVVAAAKMASARGLPIFLDASSLDASDSLEALPPMEIFSLDAETAYRITGVRPEGADSALRASLLISRRVNTKYLLLRLGERGAFIYDGRYHSMTPSFPIQKLVDRSAEGDAFFAALALEYLETDDLKWSSRFASAVGAMTASSAGAAVSIPEREEVMRFIERHKTI